MQRILRANAHKPGPDIGEVDVISEPDASRVLSLFGRPARAAATPDRSGEVPASLRDLAFVDRIVQVSGSMLVEPKPEPPGRVYVDDLAILKLLDRNGTTMPTLIGRAVMPGKSDSQRQRKLQKLYRQGLVGKRTITLADQHSYRGQRPHAFDLTPAGFRFAQRRGAIDPDREFRKQENARAAHLPHDHHALAWVVEFHHLIGNVATDNWRTHRYASGRFAVPQTSRPGRRPIAPTDVQVGFNQFMFNVPQDEHFADIKPDVAAELYVKAIDLRFDLLVEYQHHAKHSDFDDKMRRYNAFLAGWCLEHRRFKKPGTRPVVVVVAADPRELLTLARRADGILTGAVGVQATGPTKWNYHARRHVFFALEEDVPRQPGGTRAAAARARRAREPR